MKKTDIAPCEIDIEFLKQCLKFDTNIIVKKYMHR